MAADLSLKNQFLLAMPGLTGTYFGETLTFICEHNSEGAMGIIVNRPSHVSLVELVSQLGINKGAHTDRRSGHGRRAGGGGARFHSALGR